MGPERRSGGDGGGGERRAEAEALLKRISDAQERAAGGFRPDVSKLPERPECPLLAPGDVEIDWGAFERLLSEMLGILGDWTGEPRLQCGPGRSPAYRPRPAAEVRLGDGERAAVLALAMGGAPGDDAPGPDAEALAGSLDAAPELLAPALRASLAPFLSAYARELAGRFDAETYLGRRCPVCGAEPFMAELEKEDGKRRLVCGLCGTRWRFPRMKCPFCGSEQQHKLGFLEVDGYEGYRVNVCDGCMRYLKTVDRRVLVDPPAPELADVLTAELDRAALESGYRASDEE